MSSASSAVPSSSTSVTPRQRPKACQLNPSNQFTIGLPPSPSPRNILSSPIDAPSNFKAPSKTPENFNAQFEVDFNNIDNQTTPTTLQSSSTSITSTVAKPQESEKFDNLFKSDLYPDPFVDNDDEIVEIQQTRGQQLFETTESPQQVMTKVNHRRYLSDTSGIKR